MTQNKPDPKEAAILTKAVELAETQDTFKAIEHVQGEGDPVDVARRFSNLVRKLYFEKKDVARMVMLGRAGIQFALSQAVQ